MTNVNIDIDNSTTSERFLGLTKIQFLGALVAAVAIIFLMQAFTVYQQENLARQGNQAHAALCVAKQDKIQQLARTKAYVASDTNGTIFGIPRAVWVQSEHDLEATIHSYSGLNCK